MQSTRYTYSLLGVIFCVLIGALALAWYHGWGWYILAFWALAACLKISALVERDEQPARRSPFALIGFAVHKLTYFVAAPLARLELSVQSRMVGRFESNPTSVSGVLAPLMREDLDRNSGRLGLTQEQAEPELSAEEHELESNLIAKGLNPSVARSFVRKTARQNRNLEAGQSTIKGGWQYLTPIFSISIRFVIFMMLLIRRLERMIGQTSFDSTSESVTEDEYLLSIEEYRLTDSPPDSFDGIEASGSTIIGWAPELDELKLAYASLIYDRQYGRALEAAAAAFRIQRSLRSEVYAGAPPGARLEFQNRARFWIGAVLGAIPRLSAPETVARFYALVADFKVSDIPLLEARHGNLKRAPEAARRLWTRLRPSLSERLAGLGVDDAKKRDLSAYRTRIRDAAAEAYLAFSVMRLAGEPDLITELEWKDVGNAVPPNGALLDFIRFTPIDEQHLRAEQVVSASADRYGLFLTRAGATRYFDLGSAAKIDELVQSHREAIYARRKVGPQGVSPADSETAVTWQATARHLWDALIGPVADLLEGATHLIVSPDGSLGSLPFETLGSAEDRLLLDEFDVSYLESARFLMHREFERSSRPPVVVGAPDFGFGADNRVTFTPLEGAQRELQAIAGLLGVEPLLGDSASERSMKELKAPSILHIATHGYYLPYADEEDESRLPSHGRLQALTHIANPQLRCGLAMAGANVWLADKSLSASDSDGLLTADDVLDLDLSGTQLVVLSACETGLGEARFGEGVFGLRRAFLIAGAQSMVVSLWQVPDDSTRKLMVAFYQNLQSGLRKDHALRQAKLTLRQSRPHPRDWAAFICLGEAEPIC